MDVPIGGYWSTGASNPAVYCLQQICIAFSMKTLIGAIAANIDAAQKSASAK